MRIRFEKFRQVRLGEKCCFSELKVGDKFATANYMWEKLDPHMGLILDVIEEGSCRMLGRRRPFFPWSMVEGVHSQAPITG